MISMRQMLAADLPAAQGLLSQLGYPLGIEELRRRYDAVFRSEGHSLMVAECQGSILALCHVYARPALDKPLEAVVQALVVDQAYRGSGIGKIMMQAAETWAVQRELGSLVLSSHASRHDAHAFYSAVGYQRDAISHIFRKTLR